MYKLNIKFRVQSLTLEVIVSKFRTQKNKNSSSASAKGYSRTNEIPPLLIRGFGFEPLNGEFLVRSIYPLIVSHGINLD